MSLPRKPITLRPVRSSASYKHAMIFVEAAGGQVQYSDKLKGLISGFMRDVQVMILPEVQRSGGQTQFPYTDPADDIFKELSLYRSKYYSSVDDLAALLADNPIIWAAPLSRTTPRASAGGHESLVSHVINAIDWIVLHETRLWWNQHADVPQLSEQIYLRKASGQYSYPLPMMPCLLLEVPANYRTGAVLPSKFMEKLPFKSDALIDLTTKHLEALSKHSASRPELGLLELNHEFPPRLDNEPFSRIKQVVAGDPYLLMTDVQHISKSLGPGSKLAHLIQATIEAVIGHNVDALAKDPGFMRSFSESGLETRAPGPSIDPGATVPGRPLKSVKPRPDVDNSEHTIPGKRRRSSVVPHIRFVAVQKIAG